MARKNKDLPLLERVPITATAAEGMALAKVDGLVVFVPFVVPGDVVDIQLYKKKKNYAEGRAVHFHTLSPDRVDARCPHFGTCGGCKWQTMSYPAQLAAKQQQVRDNLERLGNIDCSLMRPICGSENIYYYRNKLEFTFSNRSWLTKEQLAQDTPPPPAPSASTYRNSSTKSSTSATAPCRPTPATTYASPSASTPSTTTSDSTTYATTPASCATSSSATPPSVTGWSSSSSPRTTPHASSRCSTCSTAASRKSPRSSTSSTPR